MDERTEAPDLFDRFGRDLLGPWEAQAESVQQAWRDLAASVADRRRVILSAKSESDG